MKYILLDPYSLLSWVRTIYVGQHPKSQMTLHGLVTCTLSRVVHPQLSAETPEVNA